MYTKKVDMITEMSGAIAETQKSFLFFFPWIIERDSVITTYSQRKTNMWFWSMLMLSYNVLSNQKECQEGCTDQYCLPIPLQQEYKLNCFKCSNIGVLIRQEQKTHKVQYLTPWWTFPQTDFMTDTISLFLVKLTIPRNPFSCWRAMVMAAPAMNPTMAAWDKNSMINPSLSQCSITD